jgi:biofilm protein TabA
MRRGFPPTAEQAMLGGGTMTVDTKQRLAQHVPKPVYDVLAAYLVRPDLATRPTGPEELGSGMRAILQRYESRPRTEGRWEAHRAFWDLQLVLSGTELFGWAPLEDLLARSPFDESRDLGYLEGDGEFVTLSAGRFALVAPADAHMPGIASARPSAVWKVVFKIPTGLMG